VYQKKEAFEQIIDQSQQHLVGGDFQKAIDSYNSALEKYPDEKVLLDNYIMTVERVKQLADEALDAKVFILAEKVYSVLLNNYSRFKKFDKSVSFTKKSLNIKLKNCKVNMSKRQARQYLIAGDFKKAIDSYKACYKEYPDDPVLLDNYINTIEDMKNLADRALSRENFVSAGKIYQALWKNYKYFKKFYKSLSFPEKYLDEGLKNCRSQLTKEGLEQYRKGKLADAISTWKGILIFDPNNQEIKKAIDTATVQLKNLKKK